MAFFPPLHHITYRVRNNPRLADHATQQLHAATDALENRGHPLSQPDNQADNHGWLKAS